jgi:hypothetical protein
VFNLKNKKQQLSLDSNNKATTTILLVSVNNNNIITIARNKEERWVRSLRRGSSGSTDRRW